MSARTVVSLCAFGMSVLAASPSTISPNGQSGRPAPPAFHSEVSRVISGDTLEVNRDGEALRVCLYDVTCPRLGQVNADFAKKMTERAAREGPVWVFPSGKKGRDQEGRVLVRIWTPKGWLSDILQRFGAAARHPSPDAPSRGMGEGRGQTAPRPANGDRRTRALSAEVAALKEELSQTKQRLMVSEKQRKQALAMLAKLLKEPESSTPSVIESRIDGEFQGWDGETIFKLANGQIWQQASYAYHYHYAYSPEVTIYQTSQGYKMKVEGVEETILVRRLK